MSQDLHSLHTSQSVPLNSVTVDAVNFIMDNIFDWDAHQQHAGLRMSYQDYKKLSQSLKANLQSTCPGSRSADAVELYAELLHNNWAGEFQDIRDLTRRVVVAAMEAEVGEPQSLKSLTLQLKGKIDFMEAHYPAVRHREEVPMHVKAAVMDKREDGPRQKVEGLQALAAQAQEVIDRRSSAETSQARRKFTGLFKLANR
ncbi:MAG: hypothetical protein NDJ24_00275 [Alphaproteobacteria bacterium]|nr:hypothetical protein [Alphaproteobacteria bacterium]